MSLTFRNSHEMDQLQENYFLRIDLTVESSFANKFTSPWTCLQTFVEYLLKLSRTCFQQNYVSMNLENFSYPRTLTTTNKNDSTIYLIVSTVLYFCYYKNKHVVKNDGTYVLLVRGIKLLFKVIVCYLQIQVLIPLLTKIQQASIWRTSSTKQ